jgi:hypothetical protein
LRHNDFEFKRVNLNSILKSAHEVTEKKKCKEFSSNKIPALIEEYNLNKIKESLQSDNFRIDLESKSQTECLKTTLDLPQIFSSISTKTMQKSKQLVDIDKFLTKKASISINEPWNLNRFYNNFKKRRIKTWSNRSGASLNLNLFQDIKQLLREKYAPSPTKNTKANKSNDNQLKELEKPKLFSKSYYLQKLENNFYERKIWNNLIASSESSFFNFYGESSFREYNQDFNLFDTSETKSTIEINTKDGEVLLLTSNNVRLFHLTIL